MKNEAINALIEMGMPANIKGFRYIVEIICMYDNDEKLLDGKLTDIYQTVAQNHNSNLKAIDRALRQAFEIVITKGDRETVKKYLSLQHKTNGNLLSILYYRLKMKMENDNV